MIFASNAGDLPQQKKKVLVLVGAWMWMMSESVAVVGKLAAVVLVEAVRSKRRRLPHSIWFSLA